MLPACPSVPAPRCDAGAGWEPEPARPPEPCSPAKPQLLSRDLPGTLHQGIFSFFCFRCKKCKNFFPPTCPLPASAFLHGIAPSDPRDAVGAGPAAADAEGTAPLRSPNPRGLLASNPHPAVPRRAPGGTGRVPAAARSAPGTWANEAGLLLRDGFATSGHSSFSTQARRRSTKPRGSSKARRAAPPRPDACRQRLRPRPRSVPAATAQPKASRADTSTVSEQSSPENPPFWRPQRICSSLRPCCSFSPRE